MKYFIALIVVFMFTLNCDAQTAEPLEKPQLTEESDNANSTAEKPSDTPIKAENASAAESSDAQKRNPTNPENQNHNTDSFFKPNNILTITFGGLAFIVSVWSLWQNKKSNQSQNRAYVHANKAQIIEDMFGVRISLEGINTGQTPAKWWATAFKCGIYRPGETELQDHVNFEEISDFSIWASLATNIPLTAGLDCKDGKSLIKNARQNRELCFFVYGIIRYETMFNEIFESQFVFCHVDPLIGEYLSRPNIKIETYAKVKR